MGTTLSVTYPRPEKGPMKLYIGSLHVNITEDMLRGIFEPFGRIQTIQLVKEKFIAWNILFNPILAGVIYNYLVFFFLGGGGGLWWSMIKHNH